MTLVVCPNLAIDRMLATDRVRLGGMSRCRELRTQAGGKGANVLRATRALGGAGLLTGFAAGRAGEMIVELARDEGLELEVVVTDGEARASTVVLGDDGSVTRLYEAGPAVGASAERALADLAGRRPAAPGEWAVVTGAAPPGVSPGFYAALLLSARAAGYRVLVDATGVQLAGALDERPDLVKVNVAEACSAVGASGAHCDDEGTASPAELVAEGLELARRLCAAGAGAAMLTLGAAGAAGVLGGEEWRVDHAAGPRREPRRLGRLLLGRAHPLAAARGGCGHGAPPGRRGRRRQRRFTLQRLRGPGAGERAGGRRCRRPARAQVATRGEHS